MNSKRDNAPIQDGAVAGSFDVPLLANDFIFAVILPVRTACILGARFP
jgi:hypothetical protein